jgi:hypothetical protein
MRNTDKAKAQPGTVQDRAAEPAPAAAAQITAQTDIGESPQGSQSMADTQEHETDQHSDQAVSPENDSPEYLPDAYDTGCLTADGALWNQPPIGREWPHPIAPIPQGTCLIFERRILQPPGVRRVVSVDGRYRGYTCLLTVVAYAPRPMQPGFREALELIRRIP